MPAKEAPNRHVISLEIVERARQSYYGIKKIVYRDQMIVGYILDEKDEKDCDQNEDVSFYYFDVDWNLSAQKAIYLLDAIHKRIRHQYYDLNQILWWNINYWAFFKTLHIYATMKRVNKDNIVVVLKLHCLEKLSPFTDIMKKKTKKPFVTAILYCLNTLCNPKQNSLGELVIGEWS